MRGLLKVIDALGETVLQLETRLGELERENREMREAAANTPDQETTDG